MAAGRREEERSEKPRGPPRQRQRLGRGGSEGGAKWGGPSAITASRRSSRSQPRLPALGAGDGGQAGKGSPR